MRTMQMILGVGVSLLLSMASCRKDAIQPNPSERPQTETPAGDDDVPSDTVVTRPDSVVNQPPIGTGTQLIQMGDIRLSYDASQRLTSYDSYSNLGYVIAYEGDKPVRLNFTKHSGHAVYTYTDDRVSEVTVYNGYNEVAYRYRFAYSGNKVVRETKISYVTNPNGWLVVSDYAYDSRDNLTRIVVSAAPSGLEQDLKFSYEVKLGGYDDRTNPMPYVNSYVYLSGIQLSRNNPGYRETPSSKELYSYAYSEKGLPAERSVRLEGYSTPPAVLRYLYR